MKLQDIGAKIGAAIYWLVNFLLLTLIGLGLFFLIITAAGFMDKLF